MRRHSVLLLVAAGALTACDYGLTVNDRGVFSPPASLAVTDPRDGRTLSLTWERPAQGGLSALRLVRRANERPISPDDANAEVVYEGLDAAFVDGEDVERPLVLDTKYHYALYAAYDEGFSDALTTSEVLSAFLPPSALEARARLDGTIALTWQMPEPRGDVTGVVLSRGDKVIFDGDALEVVDDNATPGAPATYSLATRDQDGILSTALERTVTPFVDTSTVVRAVDGLPPSVTAVTPIPAGAGGGIVMSVTLSADDTGDVLGAAIPADRCYRTAAVVRVDATGAAGSLLARFEHHPDVVFEGFDGDCSSVVDDIEVQADGSVLVTGGFANHVFLRGADGSAVELATLHRDRLCAGFACDDAFIARIEVDGHIAWAKRIGRTDDLANEGGRQLALLGADTGVLIAAIEESDPAPVSFDGVVTNVPAGPHAFLVRFSTTTGALESPVLFEGVSDFGGIIGIEGQGAHLFLALHAGFSPILRDGVIVVAEGQDGVLALDHELSIEWTASLTGIIEDIAPDDGGLVLVGSVRDGAWAPPVGAVVPLGGAIDDDDGFILKIDLQGGARRVVPFGTGVGSSNVARLLVRSDGGLDLFGAITGTTVFGPADEGRLVDAVPEARSGFLARVDATGGVRFVRPVRGELFSVAGLVELGGGDTWLAGDFAGPLTFFDDDDATMLEAPVNPFATAATEGYVAVVSE